MALPARITRFIVSALLLANGPSAQAQAVLEEVVVTAQKREERLQDVPVSVTAQSGEQLRAGNLVELETFSMQTPNLHISESAIGDKLFIRGIGSGINPGFEQSVGTFSDGVYYGRSLQTRAQLFDIERVEVLRGPQSTFFGNNAIAGALNITTRRPTQEVAGYINSFYEFEHNERHVEGAIGGALSDTVGVRAAGLVSGLDGWVSNLDTGETEGDEDNRAARVSFDFTPGGRFDATLKLEAGGYEVLGRNLQNVDCPPATGAQGVCAITAAPVLAVFGPPFDMPLVPDFDDSFDGYTQYNGPVPQGFTSAVNTLGAEEAGMPIPPPHPNTRERDLADLENFNLTLIMNRELGGGHVFTSVSGFSEYDFDFSQTADFLPVPMVGVDQFENFEQFSQELRIVSRGGEAVDWLAGIYYQTNELSVQEAINLYLPPPYFQPASTWFTDPCRLPLHASDPQCRLPATIAGIESLHRQEEDSYAAFASVTWNLSDSLRTTVGGRYMSVEKILNRAQDLRDGAPGITVPCPPAPVAGCVPRAPLLLTAASPPAGQAFGWGIGALELSRTDSDFMPAVNLQWGAGSRMMLYAGYSRGFKAGGYDQRNLFLDPVSGQFGPENVDAWEAGMKSYLLGGDMRLNLAVFHSDYEDLQVSTFDGIMNFLVNNAASARSRGIEMDLRRVLNDSLVFGAAVALLDAEWKDFRSAQCTALALATAPNAACVVDPQLGLLVQDLSGGPMLMAPDYSGNVSVEHYRPLDGGLEVQSQLLVYFQDDKFLAADNDPATLQDSFTKLNLRVALVSDRGWELAVVGRNLTDKLTSAHAEDVPLRSVNSFFRLTDRSRSLAAQFQYRF